MIAYRRREQRDRFEYRPEMPGCDVASDVSVSEAQRIACRYHRALQITLLASRPTQQRQCANGVHRVLGSVVAAGKLLERYRWFVSATREADPGQQQVTIKSEDRLAGSDSQIVLQQSFGRIQVEARTEHGCEAQTTQGLDWSNIRAARNVQSLLEVCARGWCVVPGYEY